MSAPVEEEEVSNEIFTVVENMPSFPGGDKALMQYVGKNMKYPVIAQENGIQGRVIVSFVIERDGKVADAVVVRGVDPSLDNASFAVKSESQGVVAQSTYRQTRFTEVV